MLMSQEAKTADSGLRIRTEVKAQGMASAEAREADIVIEDLNLSYGDNHVLHDISMDIEDRRVTAFIGPSGCGRAGSASRGARCSVSASRARSRWSRRSS